MARFISKTNSLLHRHHHHHRHPFKPFAPSLRHRSSEPTNNNPAFVELDLPASSSTSSSEGGGGEYEVTMRLFEDLIHRILVKKATPDWLPFVPGSSFWVPPRPSPSNVADLVHKLTTNDLPPDESLSLASLQGWPSSNFFLSENEHVHGGDTGVDVNTPEGVEGTVKLKVLTISDNIAHSEDEEG